MAAPSLTASERKRALSGKKNKKKVVKNVLGLPKSLKVESYVIDKEDSNKLTKILERLLTMAKLPYHESTKSKDVENKQTRTPEELKLLEEAKNKRNQLSLGVNSLNRDVKKKLITAAIVASDIQPRFLIHHLNLLCSHNEIPFFHMPGLRKITQQALGFPCIALGFKKGFSDFVEAVEEIKSVSHSLKLKTVSVTEGISEISMSESDEEVESDNINTEAKEETPFTYLYRTSLHERVFVPENSEAVKKPPEKSDIEFIPISQDDVHDNKTGDTEKCLNLISSNSGRKKRKRPISTGIMDFNRNDDDEGDNEERYYTVLKKKKKDWVIDTVGDKKKLKYSPANVLRVPSNPNRIKKKNK